jgi:8-oxo-dGTP pyrophosphatase MutT (NUDIX family)
VELAAAGALREVAEETGIHAEIIGTPGFGPLWRRAWTQAPSLPPDLLALIQGVVLMTGRCAPVWSST